MIIAGHFFIELDCTLAVRIVLSVYNISSRSRSS